MLDASPAKLQRPYLRSNSSNPFTDVSHSLARRCGSRLSTYTLEQAGDSFEFEEAMKGKHVVSIELPPLEPALSGASRKASIISHRKLCVVRIEEALTILFY